MPRLVVFRSHKHMSAQIIDDYSQKVIMGMTTLSKDFKTVKIKTSDKNAAKEIGKLFAQKVISSGIKAVCFDRAGYKYHGRVKSFAEGAKEAGLKF